MRTEVVTSARTTANIRTSFPLRSSAIRASCYPKYFVATQRHESREADHSADPDSETGTFGCSQVTSTMSTLMVVIGQRQGGPLQECTWVRSEPFEVHFGQVSVR